MMSSSPQELFELYAPEALAVDPSRAPKLQFALPSYIRESYQITRRAQQYWDKGPDGQPGLKIAESRYTQAQTVRHQEILTALGYATGIGLIKPEQRAVVGPKVERAQFICDEIEAACAFVLDDGVEDEDDRALASLQEAEDRLGSGAAAMGQLLVGWTALGTELGPKLAQLGDWDAALVAEGKALAQELLTARDSVVSDEEATRLKRAARGLLTLAHDEMAHLRRMATYVWRNHPATRQQFFSEIARKKRARQRALKAAAGA
jgi:ribosomal protein L17